MLFLWISGAAGASALGFFPCAVVAAIVVSYAQSIYMHPRLTRQGAPRTQAPRGCVGVWPQPLGSQAQVKVQLKKFHYPMGAKGELLGPGHNQGRRQATQGAEEKDKWVWVAAPTAHVKEYITKSRRGSWVVFLTENY